MGTFHISIRQGLHETDEGILLILGKAEISELARREAHDWNDPWVALAAQEHEARAESQRALLRRLGAPVIAATEELLEQKVLAEYESLRRSRRI